MSANIDVSPLASPVNVFAWNAAQIRQTLQNKALIASLAPDRVAQLEQSAAWFDALAKKIDYRHNNPVMLIAVGNLTLEMKAREGFIQLLQAIGTASAEAAGAKPAAPPVANGWATVPSGT